MNTASVYFSTGHAITKTGRINNGKVDFVWMLLEDGSV
jgi:hypothetical protein